MLFWSSLTGPPKDYLNLEHVLLLVLLFIVDKDPDSEATCSLKDLGWEYKWLLSNADFFQSSSFIVPLNSSLTSLTNLFWHIFLLYINLFSSNALLNQCHYPAGFFINQIVGTSSLYICLGLGFNMVKLYFEKCHLSHGLMWSLLLSFFFFSKTDVVVRLLG